MLAAESKTCRKGKGEPPLIKITEVLYGLILPYRIGQIRSA